jgi:hypothetical protein
MNLIVCPVRPHPVRVLQETIGIEFLRLVKVFLGVVDVPDVNEDGSALGNAIAIIKVVLGGGMRHT